MGILRCGKTLPPQLNLVIEIEFADAATALWSENAGAHPSGATLSTDFEIQNVQASQVALDSASQEGRSYSATSRCTRSSPASRTESQSTNVTVARAFVTFWDNDAGSKIHLLAGAGRGAHRRSEGGKAPEVADAAGQPAVPSQPHQLARLPADPLALPHQPRPSLRSLEAPSCHASQRLPGLRSPRLGLQRKPGLRLPPGAVEGASSAWGCVPRRPAGRDHRIVGSNVDMMSSETTSQPASKVLPTDFVKSSRSRVFKEQDRREYDEDSRVRTMKTRAFIGPDFFLRGRAGNSYPSSNRAWCARCPATYVLCDQHRPGAVDGGGGAGRHRMIIFQKPFPGAARTELESQRAFKGKRVK